MHGGHSHSERGGHSHSHGGGGSRSMIDQHELTHEHHHSSPALNAKKIPNQPHDGHHKPDHDSDWIESIVPIASFLWNIGHRIAPHHQSKQQIEHKESHKSDSKNINKIYRKDFSNIFKGMTIIVTSALLALLLFGSFYFLVFATSTSSNSNHNEIVINREIAFDGKLLLGSLIALFGGIVLLFLTQTHQILAFGDLLIMLLIPLMMQSVQIWKLSFVGVLLASLLIPRLNYFTFIVWLLIQLQFPQQSALSIVDLILFSIMFTMNLFLSRWFLESCERLLAVDLIINRYYRRFARDQISGRMELVKSPSHLHQRKDHEDYSCDAERIIKIIKRLKKLDVFSEFTDDIKFASEAIESGRDLYKPDMETICSHHVELDNMTKNFLMYSSDQHFVDDCGADLANGGTNNDGHPHSSTPFSHKHELDEFSLHMLSPTSQEFLNQHPVLNWNYPIFELATLTANTPLYHVGQLLFSTYDFVKKFKIDPKKLEHFLERAEHGYLKHNPYHNNIHGADVTLNVNYLINQTGIITKLKDTELFSLILGALIHDFQHPGRNNAFEVATQSTLAINYNDISVLENHHLASAFRLMKEAESDILSGMTPQERKEVRQNMIDLVLATDFSKHFEILGLYKSRKNNADFVSKATLATNKEDRMLVLKIALKMADIGHTSKSKELHLEWTQRVSEEFFKQGDEESKHGLTVSPFMNRKDASIPKSQCGFIGFLVQPLFVSFAEQFPEIQSLVEQVDSNLTYWKQRELEA